MTALRGELGGSQHPRRHYFSRYNEWLKLPDYNIEPGADESNRPGRQLSVTDDMPVPLSGFGTLPGGGGKRNSDRD